MRVPGAAQDMKGVAGPPEAVRWATDGAGVDIMDQTLLPEREQRRVLRTVDEVIEAIRSMRVRGAPAIGVVAAMGLAVEMAHYADDDAGSFTSRLKAASEALSRARPTAVNLGWAVARTAAAASGATPVRAIALMRAEATRILDEDREMCRLIGQHALSLFPDDARMMTHCNAGALATAGIGTALAPVYTALAVGRAVHVFATETRPLLQGSRLTAWELERAGVDITLVPDSVAAVLLAQRRVDLVIVGADRIAANGDVANKIGTYSLAVLAGHHGVPFYVAAPTSTIDVRVATGDDIPIEVRDPDEVRRGFGRLTAPADVPVFAPAFDITPWRLVTALITERGVIRPPFTEAIARLRLTSTETTS